jgi:hypothetical protein
MQILIRFEQLMMALKAPMTTSVASSTSLLRSCMRLPGSLLVLGVLAVTRRTARMKVMRRNAGEMCVIRWCREVLCVQILWHIFNMESDLASVRHRRFRMPWLLAETGVLLGPKSLHRMVRAHT